jgi:hypothetical protein
LAHPKEELAHFEKLVHYLGRETSSREKLSKFWEKALLRGRAFRGWMMLFKILSHDCI